MNRKHFIQLTAGITGLGAWLVACVRKNKKIKGRIAGASAAVGHLLRQPQPLSTEAPEKKKVVIIGGGISGLSAANYLHRQGITDFVLLDLEAETGGNAASGRNAISAYPWGAHYIPVPNNDLAEYHAFLEQCNVITGYTAAGLPIYNEAYLCFAPEERLYINGRWQDGLVPHYGVPSEEVVQIEKFLAQMNLFRYQKGSDGKDAFAIPVSNSSKDIQFTSLDQLTMQQWLQQEGYTSQYLHDYVNYCCRDDFGTPHHLASAWAGIHYYASRKGKAANADHSDVLTWPEGNGFLAAQLKKGLTAQLRNNSLAIQVTLTAGTVRVDYINSRTKQTHCLEASHCILAVPQFVAARLLQDAERQQLVKQHLQYAPWMVANLTVGKLEERSGASLSWDNVIHGNDSLGYVEATHSLLQQYIPQKNLTYYLPLTRKSPAEERAAAYTRTHEEWVELILQDLQRIHPNIRDTTEEVNVMVWGHAMAQPLPGLISGDIRNQLSATIQNRIYFAHTDLAGISIFEEAFYQGLAAAKQITALVNHPS